MDYELIKLTKHITFYNEMDTLVFKDKEKSINMDFGLRIC